MKKFYELIVCIAFQKKCVDIAILQLGGFLHGLGLHLLDAIHVVLNQRPRIRRAGFTRITH
jgi:hypothetical protein